MKLGSAALLYVLVVFSFFLRESACVRQTPLIPIPGDQTLNHTLFWGTYRPNVYFGVRGRTPNSPLFGMMWLGVDDLQAQNHLRHACEQGDLERYGWVKHDGVSFGEQELVDGLNNVLFKTWFVKKREMEQSDGEWSARITAEKKSPPLDKGAISLFIYVALPDEVEGSPLASSSSTLQLVGTHSKKGLIGDIQIEGSTPELGGFSFVIRAAKKSNKSPKRPTEAVKLRTASPELAKVHFVGLHLPPDDVWQVRQPVERLLQAERHRIHSEYMNALAKKRSQSAPDAPLPPPPSPLTFAPTLPNTIEKGSNVYVFQFTFLAPFNIDLAYLSHALHASLAYKPPTTKKTTSTKPVGPRPIPDKELEGMEAVGEPLTNRIDSHRREFERRFEAAFGLSKKGFSPAHQKFAMAAFSNLIGGVGYFSGAGILMDSETGDLSFTPPLTLYSAVPSRSFFPRGFLWDEGFHSLILNAFDPAIPREVQRHWFNLMENSGWIPREQILGGEARSRVPEQFQPQNPIIANPPTFLFLLHNITLRSLATKTRQAQPAHSHALHPHNPDSFATTSSDDGEFARDLAYLTNAFPHVERNYDWFMNSQSGIEANSFRWRGRTVNHTLASGLDDYPRAMEPSEFEQHLDLLCWMATYAQVMADLALLLGRDPTKYVDTHRALLARIETVHWNEMTATYSDVSSFNRATSTVQHSPHIGYISLFPVLLGHVAANNPHLQATLQHLHDTAHMWSSNGLRSLSISDPAFGTGENYWKGPIWININYLTLSALHKHYLSPDAPYRAKAKDVYDQLRDNLIRNMLRVYQQTGYLWEQYHPTTGNGQGCRPFNGWSSLIVLIMAEIYP